MLRFTPTALRAAALRAAALRAAALRAAALLATALHATVLLAGPVRAQEWGPWRAVGPLDFDWTAGAENALPVADELEALAAGGGGPNLDRVLAGKGGAEVFWQPLQGGDLERPILDVGRVDLNAAIEAPDVDAWGTDARVLLYRSYTAAEAGTLVLRFGSDDGLRVWWNGQIVAQKVVHRALVLGTEEVAARVAAGTNHLLVEVSNVGGAWGFQMAGRSDGTQAEINAAIDRGVRFLLDTQLLDGSWGAREAFGGGHAAFCAYTLLKCGLEPDHSAVRRALAYARTRGGDYTYTVASEILAQCALGARGDRRRIEELVDRLVDWPQASGLLSYPLHPDGGVRANGDLSNTLFAALALRAAAHAGVKVPTDTWKELIEGTLRNQEREHEIVLDDGTVALAAGFYYWTGAAVTGSMTSAGIGILAIAEEGLGRKLSVKARRELEVAKRNGVNWLAAHMTFRENPGQKQSHHYFHVYGIERVGSLLGLVEIGGVDWYRVGASYLVDMQDPSGSWKPSEEMVDTLLALLFLKRATAPSSGAQRARSQTWRSAAERDVVLSAHGDTPLDVWVLELSDAALAEYAWPGEQGAGLHVERVEYRAQREGDLGEPTVFAVVEGDPGRPTGLERFEARIELPANGRWHVSARVTVHASPDAAQLSSERVALESGAMPVDVREVLRPEWLEYAHDRERNLALQNALAIEVSSQHGEGQRAELAFDGSHATRWHSAVDDRAPWIRVTPERAFRVSAVLLSHAWPRLTHGNAPRPRRVAIDVNDGEAVIEADVDPDPLQKTRVDLGKARRILSLEVRVLDSRNRALGTDAVGFSEIELIRE